MFHILSAPITTRQGFWALLITNVSIIKNRQLKTSVPSADMEAMVNSLSAEESAFASVSTPSSPDRLLLRPSK